MALTFSSNSPALAGALFMVLAGALFALVNTLIQYGAMVLGVPSATLAFWQYLMAFLFALRWLFANRRSAFRTEQLHWHILRVLFAATGVQLWVAGLAHVPIWQAIAIIMLSPFFATAGAGLFLKEEVTPQRWMAVIAGIAGGAIILAPWSDGFSIAVFLPLGAAFFWALTSLVTKHMSREERPESLTFYLLLLLTPVNGLVAWQDGFALGPGVEIAVVAFAGLLTVFAQYAIAKAYSIADAAYLQPFDHIKLPFNVALGILVFGYYPPGSLWLGSAIIIAASFALMRQEGRMKTAASPA